MNIEIKNSNYTTQEKLQILADAAKYDVACTSSGSSRRGKKGELGNTEACGICHSFAADGRCISLLKILMTNHCAYDCKYCINRASNDVKRATFTPEEICELTIEFYRRNYIEGLFLSSGVLKNPTYTMEKMCETLLLLRTKYHFNGYIHVKTIPGASDELLAAAGYLADRISVNLELPTEESLRTLAPNKTMKTILNPMGKVQNTIAAHRMAIGKTAYMERSRGNQLLNNGIFSEISKRNYRESLEEKKKTDRLSDGKDGTLPSQKEMGRVDGLLTWDNAYQLAPHDMSGLKRRFAPAGQSTQMIVGATEESDYEIVHVAEALYKNFDLKRVFYSAFVNTTGDPLLPLSKEGPPLLREHRLYQADWLLRYYDFSAWELLTEEEPNFDPYLDPKCTWAVRHPEFFPVEINTAPKAALLRIPGIGPKSALRILSARRQQHLGMAELKRMGVVLKRAQYFITCNGRDAAHGTRQEIAAALLDPKAFAVGTQQLSLDDFTPKVLPDAAPAVQKLAAAGMPARQAAYEVKQEALQCLTRRM